MVDETSKSYFEAAESVECNLINILKKYFQLCRSAPDKKVLLQDVTLLKTLATYVIDKNIKVSLYICKILLILTEDSYNATTLSKHNEIVKNISLACESNLPLKIIKNLILIQSRIINAQRFEERSQIKKSFFNKSTKQFVFSFDYPTEEQKRQMEKKCLTIRGVVSICFQLDSKPLAQCIVRCCENLEAKDIAIQLLSTGLDVVQLQVLFDDGHKEIFSFYANEYLSNKQKHQEFLPDYLDERLKVEDKNIFDINQFIVTNEQLNAEKNCDSSWFSLSSLKFW